MEPHRAHPSLTREHWIANNAYRWMPSVDVVHVNPGLFAFVYLMGLPAIAHFGAFMAPFGEGLNAPPSNEDIGSVAVHVLAALMKMTATRAPDLEQFERDRDQPALVRPLLAHESAEWRAFAERRELSLLEGAAQRDVLDWEAKGLEKGGRWANKCLCAVRARPRMLGDLDKELIGKPRRIVELMEATTLENDS